MKVLHVNDCASVASNLVGGLKALGVEAELFQPTLGTYRASKLRRAALPLIRTLEAFQLRHCVQKRQFDIVHIHYASFAYMTLLTGLPYILHCHGTDLRVDLNRFGLRGLSLLGIRRARKVFYATPDLIKYLQDIRKDAIFLPDPIRLEDFVPASRNEQHPSRVLSISKLDPFKGLERIIRTIELVWEARPQLEIAIFNFGQSTDQAKRFIEEHRTQSRLILLPPIPHKDMPALINGFSIILGQQNPNIAALGVSELEAMACGKPVVCLFAYPDAYPEPPPVLASRTPEEARDHIIRLLDDPPYRLKIGQQAQEWVMRFHDYRRVAETLLRYYQA